MRRDASGGVKQLRGGLPFPSLRTRSRTFLRSPSLCRCSPVTLYAASFGISGRNEPRVLLLPAATAAKLHLVYGTGVSPREPTPKSTRRTASSRILRGAATARLRRGPKPCG